MGRLQVIALVSEGFTVKESTMKMLTLATVLTAAIGAAATLGAASIVFSGSAQALPKQHWDCNAHGCIHCWEDLDGEKCQVVLK
jgi:hypothetical protein